MFRTLCCTTTILFLLGPAAAQATDARQIHWQRSLADARALAQATGRPLLLAINMDGESASDRIVHENYRDPAFVASTRSCVCVVASVFRHSPRDHDDQGRRIPCPRLGEITCGEHMALEPALFEELLADGERVAPRHAFVSPDGSKTWDLSLCFDLRDIDRALFGSVADLSSAGELPIASDWDGLASHRHHRGRAALESALAGAADAATLDAGLASVGRNGDAGSLEALRVVAARLPSLSSAQLEHLAATARALHLERELAGALRGQVQAIGTSPGGVDPAGRAVALPVIAALDGAASGTRSFLLACRTIAGYGAPSQESVGLAFGADAGASIEERLRARGGVVSLTDLLQTAAAHGAADSAPRPRTITNAMPEADELDRRLAELDPMMKAHGDDAELNARYAKASLDLGRRHIESQQRDAQILLEDAELHWKRALELSPDRCEWWIERSRTAYFLQRFTDQVEFGRRAFAVATGAPAAEAITDVARDALDDERAVEALRWVGDGDARLLAERAGQDPAVEIGGIVEAIRALGLVAASPYGDAQDWISFASVCGALGLWHEELAIALAGAERLPASGELRQSLTAALWNGGRIDLAPAIAESIALRNAPSADALWFSGYASVLAAEDARRREDPEAALRAYAVAAAHFEGARSLRADYIASCDYWIAMTWLGRGLAQARAGRRTAAADSLVAAVGTGARIADARDGLGYDVLDLVDKTLEWRDSGPSPVEPLQLLDRLEAAVPDDVFWPNAISDSALREALRADGRNPVRAERDTVDAGGKPIRMQMGLPTEEGDAYLQAAIAAARRAPPHASTTEDKTPLAQALTIWAERMLERDRMDGVQDALAEAAPLLGIERQRPDADAGALRDLAARLRAVLGEARPRLREGR